MAELGQQIAQLMATLTQTRWGNSHTGAPGSTQECSHRCECSGGGTTVAHTLTMVGVALVR